MSDETLPSGRARPPCPAIFSLLPWLVAAGFAAIAAVLGQRQFVRQSETALLREQVAIAAIELKAVRNEIAAEQILARHQLGSVVSRPSDDLAGLKITLLSSRSKSSPQASAVVVWNPAKQEGVLKVEQLPLPATDRDYQLWIIEPQSADPVDGGVFAVEASTGVADVKFTGRQPIATLEAFAISLERKGGVTKPEGPFVLFGK